MGRAMGMGRPPIHPIVDLSGARFHSWTLLRCTTPGKGMTMTRYVCRCDCGFEEERQIANIVGGLSKCCGKFCKGQQLSARLQCWKEERCIEC